MKKIIRTKKETNTKKYGQKKRRKKKELVPVSDNWNDAFIPTGDGLVEDRNNVKMS